jgi:glycosyltransferase involved in cell wall biosynthesis
MNSSDDRRAALVRVRTVVLDPSAGSLALRYVDSLVAEFGEQRFCQRLNDDARYRLASWDQLRQIQSHGVELLAHGWHHLPQNTGLSEFEMRQEVDQPRKSMQANLGVSPQGFVFPHGRQIPDSCRIIQDAGYEFGLATQPGRVVGSSAICQLPRYDGEHSLTILRRHLLTNQPQDKPKPNSTTLEPVASTIDRTTHLTPETANRMSPRSSPQLSVVMSVYNDAAYLPGALDGILQQQGVDFELIVVNDGSTDNSRAILADYEQRDARLRVIDQPNAGLTAALIHGCRLARGQYIARHDSDDVSLPDRLARQVAFLEANPEAALVSCGTEYIGPAGETLYFVCQNEDLKTATANLRATDPSQVSGVNSHGSLMFRRASYERAGGYRIEFRYAQDLDLWMRMTDSEFLGFMPEVLYRARFTSDSISMTRAAAQRDLAAVIVACSEARACGGDERPLLERAAAICAAPRSGPAGSESDGDYFIGRMLMVRGNPAAVIYLRRAVRAKPWNLKARLALVRTRWKWFGRPALADTTAASQSPEAIASQSPEASR